MNKYFEVEGFLEGEREVLFGSFDRSDCAYEMDAEKDSWKAEGYKKIKLVSRETEESPDPEVYGGEESHKQAICKALSDQSVSISVIDSSEEEFDVEGSRDINEIFEACEATESPVVYFYGLDDEVLGCMSVAVGQGEESVVDHSANDFMNALFYSSN